MKECVLFTSTYPYGYGETFLETEISFLADSFDKIYIFALTSNTKQVRKVPHNVVFFSLNQTSFPFKHLRKMIAGLLDRNIPMEKTSFKKSLFCFYKRGTIHRATKKVISILKTNNIVFSNETLFYSYWLSDTALLSLNLKKQLGLSNICISRAHGSDVYSYAQKCGFNPFQHYIVNRLNYVFTVSEDGREYLSNLYPIFANKIMTKRLGTIDCGEQLYHKTNKVLFVTCSNIIPLKRVDSFARIFCRLAKINHNLRWACFGDGEELEVIKKIISDNKMNDYVVFFGRKTNSEILEFYRDNFVNYFVNLSSTEGLPVSIMEAISFGIPCFATNVGGTKEIINDNNGILLNYSLTEDELFFAFKKQLDKNQDMYLSMRKSAREVWEMFFNADSNYLEWCKTLMVIGKNEN